MKKKKLLTLAVTMVLGIWSLTGCGSDTAADVSEDSSGAVEASADDAASSADEQKETTGEGKVLRVAAQSYPLYSSINLAYEQGYVEEELSAIGATFEWTEFASGPLVNEAIAAGEGDIGFMADLPAIIARSSGQDIQVVSNVATGERSLAVLVPADSDIQDISELKGKKIAYATGSYAQHLLALVLDQAGLTFDDIETVNLGAADSPAALANGDVDAIVIWEQFITKLTTEGTARVLIDGTGIKRSNMVVYSVSDYAKENPEVIEAFIKAVDRGAQFIKENPDEAAAILAPRYSVTEEQMKTILGNFDFTVSLTDADVNEIITVANYANEAGIISNPVTEEEFINTSYLKEAGY